jgi:hypothetical protein
MLSDGYAVVREIEKDAIERFVEGDESRESLV